MEVEILSKFISSLDLGSAPFKTHHGFSISLSQFAPLVLFQIQILTFISML